MTKRNYNYHGHTYFCGHAGGTPMEYVLKAIELGYKNLGISEHAPMPNLPGKGSRLQYKDYHLYFQLLDEAKAYASKHNLNLYKGFEIEYFNFLDSEYSLYNKYLMEVDYLILGQHYIVKDDKLKSAYTFDSIEDIKIYSETILKALDTNYFNLIAHLELCFYNIKNPTDEMYELLRPILKKAKALNLPIELNANGIRRSFYEEKNTDEQYFRYPTLKILKMFAEENVLVHISSDNHSVKDFDDFAIKKAYELAKEFKLNLVDDLKMNYY